LQFIFIPEVILSISNEDETHELMIGEAAVSLLFNRKDITTTALLDELNVMGDVEEDDDRLLAIWSARRWLLSRRKSSYPDNNHQDWLAEATGQANTRHPHREDAIRLTQYQDED
jgi:hypothetical protein